MICKQLNCKATLFCVLEIGIKNVNWKNKVHLKITWILVHYFRSQSCAVLLPTS